MAFLIDMRVAELLASRLCHDIVGPIGAVSNGIELMEDDEFGMADDAMRLARNSARQATDSLQFFRLAYGMAGTRVGSDFSELKRVAEAYVSHGKAELDWPEVSAGDPPDGLGKLILNMIELAREALPRGGKISVELSPAEAAVSAAGQDCGLRSEIEEGLADNMDITELTPRSIHAYFTRQLAGRLGGELHIEASSPGVLKARMKLAA